MKNASNRKAVYIPSVLWEKLDADAKSNLDTVTTVLKNVLLRHYNITNIGNNKYSGSTVKASTSVEDDEEQF